ncbi:expressed unknown protein [Seminavis robusta]|uniref:Uncharacterized protein n=1 Tax=Seminavis robusta TaxID=568900 RepID=A0A9N8HP26_9STRA|nr:expressed unknown protein [Seminavis robusta]|eukprot:Sro1032_g233550.1 n/a (359) ;mRNA; f:18345-19495
MDPKEFDEMETEEEVETDDDEEEEEEETVKVGNRPFNTRAYVNSFIKVIDTTKAKKHTPDAGIDRILQVHDHMLSVQDFDASRKQYGQMAEAMSCLLESMHRWTLMAMTGFCGEQKMDRTDVFPALIDWTSGVSLVFNYCAEQKHNLLVAKPNWWYQDGMLKRISKVALNAATDIYSLAEHPETAHLFPGHEFSLAQVKATRAKVLSGCYGQALHVIRTEKEIDEAVELFMKPTIHAHGCYGTCPDLLEQMAASHVKMMTDEQTNLSALERGEAGLWVVVHGLVSQAGQAMNGKLGLVFKDGLVNGRVAVEVEGFEGEKRLLPTNLQEIPFSEMQVALISTLPIAEQWKFVRGSNKQL